MIKITKIKKLLYKRRPGDQWIEYTSTPGIPGYVDSVRDIHDRPCPDEFYEKQRKENDPCQ